MKQTVVIGISSGIAAYKVLDLITLLKQDDIDVVVTMTNHATKMLPVADVEKVSGNHVYTNLYEDGFDYKQILKTRIVDHIQLADQANAIVIAPATANTIAKIAHGFADDFLSTMLLAATCPVIICPSMNVHMWNNPLMQENLTKLTTLGFIIIDPVPGPLACGYEGKGRLAPVEAIKKVIMNQLQRTQDLIHKKIVVTAGGTIEKIDDVRYITNRSSGKMGVALAEECYLRGAEVVLLRSKTAINPRYNIPEETFETADELQTLVEKYVPNHDYIFHVAAVSDFLVEDKQSGKISSKTEKTLTLKPRKKILDHIKKLNKDIKLIAFKAEALSNEDDLVQVAHTRLIESDADLIVANDISKKNQGFAADDNEVLVIQKDGRYKKLPKASKERIAQQIIDEVIQQK